ncbi:MULTISPECIES: bifunctional 4-hydroxy-2-oxoglutarate aldolase/2-dehydro-3-deoxy-phosphogluconate aldolase [Acutalibacteraceae]|uniref:bifunctional 4-hydroxy-2-oxoglutarate aldolase/2-dehydro-3-deoxy-phosphogluconate aldolase n=1 Tax=Acutalibacteraceae TaxID=3082771 RepID=UPI0013E8B2F1|nr:MULTISPECIES: bifunctional 4-hydroxy-2-oxoglutarate aldolase/2-dehydro-3-deoxy-phosphogluconate aldolase [Acutalibacteraceae]
MNLLEEVRRFRIVVALRGIPAEQMAAAAAALFDGGIRMLEVTFRQSSETAEEDAVRGIRSIRAAMGNKMKIGAGTVMTRSQVRAAAEAGAEYILAPNVDPEVLSECGKLGLPAVPGAFTPSEIAAAWKAGAALVKLFPCGVLGTEYVRAVTSPLDHIPLLGMGGINENNLTRFLSLPHMECVGIGSAIVKPLLIQERKYQELTALAKRYTSQLVPDEAGGEI